MIRTAKDILETDHYLPLPTKFDIHKYRIMERFCLKSAKQSDLVITPDDEPDPVEKVFCIMYVVSLSLCVWPR